MDKAAGGTELQINFLNKYIDLSYYKNINLIINHAIFKKIIPGKKNILWCHHYIDQPAIQLLKNSELLKLLDAIVFVSDWQCNEFINNFNLPKEKCFVIKNAIEIEPVLNKKKEKKIKLIYTSTPWRGLEVLLNSIKYLNKIRDDFVLDVYSSTKIYGKEFDNINKKYFVGLFDEIDKTPNINSHGYVENNKIIEILEDTNIFTYPTTSNETFCIAALEALAKGCLVFVTDWGAFKELGKNYCEFIKFENNLESLSLNYAKKLNFLIDNYKKGIYENKLKSQSIFYCENYSWKERTKEWKKFLSKYK